MAISVTPVRGASHIEGNKRNRVYDVIFSGTYTANGEIVLAATVGLAKIELVRANTGVVYDSATAPTVGNPLGIIVADDGSKATFVLFESAADGDALDEKPAEATTTADTKFRVEFIGY